MSKEIWKDIKGYENIYQISNLGNVKNIKKDKLLKPFISNKTGYLQIDLSKNGIKERFSIHRLVCIAFIPNYNGYKYVNHKDESRVNNNVNNLEWCTQKYNCNYGNRNKKIGEKSSQRKHTKETKEKISVALSKAILQYDLKGNFIKEWRNGYMAQKVLNISYSNINECCNNKRKTAGGYIWRFKMGGD